MERAVAHGSAGEQSWAEWIRHGTRQGTIDQVDGLLRFHAGSEELLQWDEQIRSICGQLNGILDRASAKGLKLVEA